MPLRALLAALLLAAPATASEEVIRLDLSIRGVVAAQFVLSGRQDGAAYAVTSRVASTGMVGAIAPFSFAADARGRFRGDRPVPSAARYGGEGRDGTRSVTLRYPGGVPVVEIDPPPDPQPWDLDPATQAGRADPASIFWAAFRARPTGQVCDVTLPAFDGRRSGEMILAAPAPQDDGTVICAGEWRRLAGYAPEELAERTRFPFSLIWAPAAEGLRLTEVRAPTRWGDMVLRRR